MKRLIEYLLLYKGLLFWSLFLATASLVFSMLDPQIVRIMTDEYALKANEFTRSEFMRGVTIWGLALVGVALISRSARAFQDYIVNVLTERVGAKMYADSVTHVFNLPYRAFEDQRSGSILLNLQKARDSAKALIQATISTLFLPFISIVLVIAYAFYVHWMIAVTFIALIPVVATTTILLSRRIKGAQQKVVREASELSGSTTETLRNVSLVKSLGLENQEIDRLNKVNDQVVNLELKKIVYIRTLSFVQGTLVNAVRVAIYIVSFYLIWNGDISFGEFLVFTFYTFYVFNPLYALSELVSKYQEAKASQEELDKILSLEEDVDRSVGEKLKSIDSVEFKSVTFAHQGEDLPAVESVGFNLSPGKTIAFAGPSGAGKSTIMKLLVGLYEPQSGEVLINGLTRDEVNLDSFRARIGYVAQETELFAGTIRENLQFVRPDATDEEMKRVLEQARIDHILTRSKEESSRGLETRIGEAGIKLSGGERQRLAIARALLRDPNLIIFDEATSALDSITENGIIETIQEIRESHPDLMMVMVAHRLSTIQHADEILMMSRGQVVEQGKHSELVAAKGLYYSLWQQQALAS